MPGTQGPSRRRRPIFDAPEWLAALTLVERAALLAGDPAAVPAPGDVARAMRTVERWRRESDLLDDALFAERLAADGLTPGAFVRVLAEPVAGLGQRLRGRPPWLQRLADAFSAPAAKGAVEGEAEHGSLDVLELFRPLIAGALRRVQEGLRTIAAGAPGLLDAGSVAATLLPALTLRLRRASERTLALELQVSRMEGRLEGETPEDRFRSFVDRLRQPAAALEILQRYPVLARDAVGYAEQWVAASLEMVQRLAADRDEIVQRLAGWRSPGSPGPPGLPGPLVGVAAGLGDYHAGGRSVAVLSFRSGFRVVYKPKPLAVDVRFWELIAWLDDRGAEPPLRRLAVVDRGTHGWVEHVAAGPCESAAEVARFHARQGAWVALFYVLEANDFHHENVIAAGEDPVPIDLETLFQPARPAPAAGGPGYVPTAHTVLNGGLLPRRFWATASESGLDLSGMGTVGGQTVTVRRITGQGTDRMRWGLQETRLEDAANLPTLRGSPVSLWEHVEPVLRGFRSERGLAAAGEPGAPPLTGFSHGAAGIAWALAWLAAESGDQRFRAASWDAIRYERSCFSPEHDNWPDLRRQEGKAGPPDFLHAWCHGAPGIGLGRAAMLADRGDPEMVSEVRAAVRSTLAEGFGGNQSLCHGDLGNLELIRAAARALDDPELAAEADRLAGRILARIEAGNLRCGTSARTESLGLMVGLAGIGYGLLRAADPERVPCVLLLETP